MHDLRTRLISDVVTGQVDVREITVPEFGPMQDVVDEQENETENEELEDE